VSQGDIILPVVFAGLIGAIAWNVTTWYFAIPSSSSHALIGGVVGAMMAHAGASSVLWSGIVGKVLAPSIAGARLRARYCRARDHDVPATHQKVE